MTEEELYAGAGEVTRKCLDDILDLSMALCRTMKKLTHRSTC